MGYVRITTDHGHNCRKGTTWRVLDKRRDGYLCLTDYSGRSTAFVPANATEPANGAAIVAAILWEGAEGNAETDNGKARMVSYRDFAKECERQEVREWEALDSHPNDLYSLTNTGGLIVVHERHGL